MFEARGKVAFLQPNKKIIWFMKSQGFNLRIEHRPKIPYIHKVNILKTDPVTLLFNAKKVIHQKNGMHVVSFKNFHFFKLNKMYST